MIYRDNKGEWHCDYTQNQYGETYDWVEDAKGQDPLAIIYKGKDFSNGSLPMVYDTVLHDRLREEYFLAQESGADTDNMNALTYFFRDNVGSLSSDVTDYLTTLERCETSLPPNPVGLLNCFAMYLFRFIFQTPLLFVMLLCP